jgi:hypothetical protein
VGAPDQTEKKEPVFTLLARRRLRGTQPKRASSCSSTATSTRRRARSCSKAAFPNPQRILRPRPVCARALPDGRRARRALGCRNARCRSCKAPITCCGRRRWSVDAGGW